MTIEELQKEAEKLGYKLVKKNSYERMVPCKECGSKRRETWYGPNYRILKCMKCGYSIKGKTIADAKRNWNIAMQMVPMEKVEDADDDNDQT